MYSMIFLASKLKTAHKTVASFLYQSMKSLLGFKNNPSSSKLIKLSLGMTTDEYMQALAEPKHENPKLWRENKYRIKA